MNVKELIKELKKQNPDSTIKIQDTNESTVNLKTIKKNELIYINKQSRRR